MRKLWLLLLLSALPLAAQTDRATVTGIITDTSGARIKDANVTVTVSSTGIAHQTGTNADGVYTLSALSVGYYKATVTASGFEPVDVESFQLNVGQTLTLDLKLTPAKVSSTVEVVAADNALDKSSAALGGVVQGSQVQELPLNGRNWVSLMSLSPGVIGSGTGTEDQMRFVGLSDEDNIYHLDGVDMSGINHA